MLHSSNDMTGYQIKARDGKIGHTKDLLFDDQSWKIRYLVVNTGDWLVGRRILISPAAIQSTDWDNKFIPVNLTKNQINQAPSLEEDKPVSQQYEVELLAYYNWPIYTGGQPWGLTGALGNVPISESEEEGDKHLRSMEEIEGYSVQAEDGSMGRICDFIIDDHSWEIRYLIVDTRKWLSGKKVIIHAGKATSINWAKSTVNFALSLRQVKNSPEYDPSTPLSDVYAEQLDNYFGQAK